MLSTEFLTEMEANQHTPSVIARLMGFDELPTQQPIHKHIRVLSEDYLQKTASIGLVKNRSSCKGHSSRVNLSKQKEFKDAFGVQIPKYRNNEIGRKSEKTTSQGNILRSLQKHEKPSFSKARNRARSSVSPSSDVVSQLSDRRNKEFPRLIYGVPYNLVTQRKNSANDVEPSRHDFRVSRVIANKTARKITHSIGNSSAEVSSTEFRIDTSFENESVVMMSSCPSFFDGKNRDHISYSSSSRLSLANEDNRQLFKRWKMTKCFQEIGAATRSSTLSEIFAVPDQETRARNLNFEFDEHGLSSQFKLNDGYSDLATPLGTCSVNGWKAENVRNLAKSRPLSASNCTTEILVSTTRSEDKYFCEEGSLVFKLSIGVPYSNSVYNHQGPLTIQDELENSYEENDVLKDLEHNSRSAHSSVDSLASVCMVSHVVSDRKAENVGVSSGISEEQQSGSTPCILRAKDVNSSHVWDDSTGQKSSIASPPSNCTKKDPEFPMSSREAYYASPNSVLEPSFEEENLSGPECFESCADLNGTWMQLQLLKSESDDTHSEGSGMAVSSDGDTGEEFFDPADKNQKFMGLFRAEESRDFSYLVDALDEAGFQGRNLEISFGTWYSPECPMGPSAFEALETKFGKQKSWEKSERRLLFDRINAGLMEILGLCMNGYMWAKPLRRRFNSLLRRDVVEEELWMLLVSQEKEVSKDLSEKAMCRDVRWLDLGDDIIVICTEIENFLFDELAAEFASNLSI